MPTPPPLPSVPPEKNKFQELARASWIAPIIGIGVNVALIGAQVPPGSPFHLIGSLLCVIGLLCGIIAFFGIPKYGVKGILVPAIVGVGITGLIVVLAVLGIVGMKARLARQHQVMAQMQQANPQGVKEGEDAVLDYPGWLGKAQVSGGMIIAVSVDETSQASRDYNSNFNKKYSLVNLSVNNTAGTETLVVDPSSIKIINADGSTQSSATDNEVLSSVSTDRQGFASRYSGSISAAPGQQLTDRWGYFASGTDYSKAVSMTVSVNGQVVTLNGQFFTPEQKKELFERGQQMQR